MQDETQNPGGDAAPEPNNAPDPGAANPPAGEAEELNQDAPAPEVATDSAAASAPTDQGAGAFDPSVTMRPEDLMDPAAPTDTDPAASTDLGDPAPQNTGVVGPQGTPPPGTAEQQEGPPPAADELEPDDAASASDWGAWTDPDPSAPTDVAADPDPSQLRTGFEHPDYYENLGKEPFGDLSEDSDPSDTDVFSEPPPEAVSMPHDVIMDPVPTDQVEEPLWQPEEEAAPPLNLADQIDPNWPVLEELNGREYAEVQDLLGDPSKLSDPEVLEDLSPDQMLAMLQAVGGHLSTPVPGVADDPDIEYVVAPEEAAQLPNLAEQIDPNWEVLEELNGREYREVEEVLEDPSKLSDPEVLEDLNPHQMQVVMQAVGGYLSTPEPSEDPFDIIEDTFGEPEDGGEMVETAVMPDDELSQEPETGVTPDAEAGDEPVDAPDASGAAVGGAAVGAGAVGAGAAGGLDDIDLNDLGGLFGGLGGLFGEPGGDLSEDLLGEASEDIGEALGIDADDISGIAQDPLGAISEVAEGYLGGIVGESPIGDILEGDIGGAALGALGDSIGGPVEDILEGDIGEAVLGGLGVSIGGPLGGVIGGALGEVAEDIIEEVPVVGDIFEAAEGVTEGLEQAAEEIAGDVFEAAGDVIDDIVPDFDFW